MRRNKRRRRGGSSSNLLVPMAARIFATQSANLIGDWNLSDPSGTNADDVSATNADGTYAGTFTLAQPGIGDGSLSTSFGGGRVSLATPITALNTAFDPLKGTIFCWAKVSGVGVWTDATSRTIFELGADANNRVFINKTNITNQLSVSHRAGGTAKTFAPDLGGTINWFSVALTWDKVADEAKCYVNGSQIGSTLNGLGVWVGALTSGFSAIADFTSAGSANNFTGFIAPVAAWKIALTATEVARISIL